ncbi:MAG TPA: type IV pilus assembly protein PilM [Pirellulaceae bacterium]
MAKSDAVWGIDIGQCALKALRCRPHDKDEKRLVVEAFDYIEYPKILTQPEANRDELIREALQQFVSRNDLAGEKVAIAVPGQSGLARFIKLPPVERKKIPDIVKYEARQQIPFALEDVVWDYQPLIGSEDEGYAIETEVGLFAMKRDQVARHLKPLEDAGIDVEIIQLAPLAIYNFICFDRLNIEGAYDPANPPQSTVIISLGTDTTDLVITNGYRVWQRSIPIGGNHFTKALTKELKLTFAKAEHLKRNAMKSENPKAIFQAMRPVFSDLVAEIQRSIGFFTSNNRNAKLGEMVALGNPMKLPGLQRFLSQNLDQPVKLVDQFSNLATGTATAGPQYKENQLTFGVAYGLCVQAQEHAQLRTNLLPDEIITTRLVKAKKPWAVAAVALLLLGLTINYFMHYAALLTANKDDPQMVAQMNAAKGIVDKANTATTDNTNLVSAFDKVVTTAKNLQSNVDGRLLWLELFKAIDAAIPKDTGKRLETEDNISKREEIHIEGIECEFVPDIAAWQAGAQRNYTPTAKPAAPAAAAPAPGQTAEANAATPATPPATPAAPAAAPATPAPDATAGAPPADGTAAAAGNSGWIIELRGYHLHNGNPSDEGEMFLKRTIIKNLELGKVKLPDGPKGELIDVAMPDLGIKMPVVMTHEKIRSVTYYADTPENVAAGTAKPPEIVGPGTAPGGGAAADQKKMFKLRKYVFIIQFCWQPQPRGQRLEKMAQKKAAEPGTAATAAEAPKPNS